MAQKVADKIMGALQNPHLKEQKKAEVELVAGVVLKNTLKAAVLKDIAIAAA